MEPNPNKVAVVTGASAGAGRATARLLARRGYDVAVPARGTAGLEAVAKDVEAAGARALAIRADVARHTDVFEAADRTEAELGPIDVWVNNAFTAVFASSWDGAPEEFRRVTDVASHGCVYGTMAALARMRPRDRGTIVQVGSALAYRGIPLQSAYCGAKHAIQGFNESLRCELLHEGSNVRTTMVQLPALDTPQFSWVLSRLPRTPQPVPPIYQPEVAARAIVHAAEHRTRREWWAAPPPPPSWPTPSPRACSSATSARGASTASRPARRPEPTGPQTSSNRWTTTPTTVRTAHSTTVPTP